MFKIYYDEPESPHEGAGLRYMETEVAFLLQPGRVPVADHIPSL